MPAEESIVDRCLVYVLLLIYKHCHARTNTSFVVAANVEHARTSILAASFVH
jgi:hypothetical protein